MDTDKLTKWLHDHIDNVETAEGPVCKLVLRQLGKGGNKGHEVNTIYVPYNEVYDNEEERTVYGRKLDDLEISDLARDISVAAWDDCEGIGGQNSYALSIYRKHDPQSKGRFTMRFLAEEMDVDASGIQELPQMASNPVASQLMRHNEALARVIVATSSTTVSQLNRTITRLSDQNEKLIADRMASLDLREEMASRKHERELHTEIQRSSEDRKDKMFSKFSLLFPIIVNKVAGKKLLPEETTAKEEMMHSFIQSLEPEQLETIRRGLSVEQQGILYEFLNDSISRNEKETENRQNLLKGIEGGKS